MLGMPTHRCCGIIVSYEPKRDLAGNVVAARYTCSNNCWYVVFVPC